MAAVAREQQSGSRYRANIPDQRSDVTCDWPALKARRTSSQKKSCQMLAATCRPVARQKEIRQLGGWCFSKALAPFSKG